MNIAQKLGAKKVSFSTAIVFFSFSFYAGTSIAQQSAEGSQSNDSAKDNVADHIVVTGTRTAKLLNNSPVLVEVIDGQVMAKIAQGTLAQGLNYIPGVVVKRSVKDGYNVQMQGFDGDHVLVLVDGQPIVSPTGSSADLDQIPTNNIVQIEVIRGAASVMYGSSAMGGVINIITDKSSDSQFSIAYDIGAYAGNTIESGDVNHTTKLAAQQQVADWLARANVIVIDDQGFDYDSATVSQDAASVEKQFVTLSALNESGSLQNESLQTQIKYQFLGEKKLRDTARVPGQSELITYQTDVTQHQIDIDFSGAAQSQTQWQVNARYIDHQQLSGQSNSLRDTSIIMAQLSGQQVYQFEGVELVVGGDFHTDKLDQFKPQDQTIEIDNQKRESAEVFVQGNWIADDHQVLAGIRSQYDSDFSWHHAGRLSGMRNFTLANGKLQWRAGIGQSYRVPNLKERFYVFDHSALGYMVLGNDQLSPETANSAQSSLTYNTTLAAGKVDWRSDVNFHYAKTADMIDSIIDVDLSAQNGIAIYRYQNISEAKLQGFDISQEFSLDTWRFQFNYSYLDSQDQQGVRLLSRPRHQVKVNFSYEFSAYDLELIAYGVYQADEAIDSTYVDVINNEFATFSVVLNQQLSSQFSWRVSANNLFNEHQDSQAQRLQLFDARPVSSLELSAGVSYQF